MDLDDIVPGILIRRDYDVNVMLVVSVVRFYACRPHAIDLEFMKNGRFLSWPRVTEAEVMLWKVVCR